MTVFRRPLGILLLVICLFVMSPPPLFAQQPAATEQLQQQNLQLHQQLREARREIARLKAADSEPGWKDAAAGLGFIFGLCGLVMMVSARRR